MLFSTRAGRLDGAFLMTRARLLLAVSAAALAGTVAGCGGTKSGPPKVPSDAVAIVGDQPVSRADLLATLAAARAGYKTQGQTFPEPGSDAYRALRNKLLDDFVQQSEFEQKAKSDPGVEISDTVVDKRIAELKQQSYGGSEQRYLAGLKSQGLTELQMRTRFRAQALADAVFAKLSTKATVSDADVEAYYKAHRTGYERPATREARQISVTTRALAVRIERQLKGGADFAKLAAAYSTDTASRDRGGQIPGGLTHGMVLPELEKAGFALKTREISAPVHTRNGWHVIQALSDLEPARTTPLSQVRRTIQQLLLQQARQKLMTTWVKATRAQFASKIAYAPGFGPPA